MKSEIFRAVQRVWGKRILVRYKCLSKPPFAMNRDPITGPIDHDILIIRLPTWYGISGTALSWFTSYITDRRQAIKIGNCFSDMLPTSCGVPQGSVLGPLLFTLYTTPLSSVIQSHNLEHHLYADDTQIYVSLTTPDMFRSLNQLIDCLQDSSIWMKNSKLKLNVDMTEFLIIGTSTQRAKLDGFFPTHILSQSITPAASVLNLGVTFDENFNFKQHISKTCGCCFTISVIFALFAGIYHFPLLKPSPQL